MIAGTYDATEGAASACADLFAGFDPRKELFEPREAGAILGVSKTTIWRLIKSGELESVTVLRSRRITRRSLLKVVREGAA